jgi:23S rRNA pseudouridine1911/1915/1917 synthase
MRSFLQHLKFIVSFLRGQLTNHDMQRTLPKSGRIQIAPDWSRFEAALPTTGFPLVDLWPLDLNVSGYTIRLQRGLGKWAGSRFFLAAAFPWGCFVVRSDLCVLYEDNHLLVVNKPAGLATMGTGGANTVHALACEYLRQKYQKPGNVYLGVVHRLDSMTSGTLVLARTSKAAARLSEQFRKSSESSPTDRPATKKNGAYVPQKSYLAVVQRVGGGREENAWHNDDFRQGVPIEGSLRDWVVKNERDHRMEVTGKSTQGAVEAVLDFRRLDVVGNRLKAEHQRDADVVVEVQLRTGRKHQIRVQFANRGWPVWGDVKYGGSRRPGTGIALHAWRLSILHPTTKNEMLFQSPLPSEWYDWFPEARQWVVE